MSSLRTVKNKINSVKSIKKIFSVMQLIAASKMKRAQEASNSSNRVVSHVKNLLIKAANNDSSFLNVANDSRNESIETLFVVFCSDRGLCGNYNSIVMRKINEALRNKKNIKIAIIGNKIKAIVERQYGSFIDHDLSCKFDDCMKDESKISVIFDKILLMKKSGAVKNCKMIYVFSKNAMSREVKEIDLFSFDDFRLSKSLIGDDVDVDKNFEEKTIYEEKKSDVIEYLSRFYFKAKFFNAFRSAYFSELASRMIAMDNASRNAQEIQNKLTLFYNKKRQANITNDLIDIINGAENL